jgi:hypothetical protein
MLVGHRNGVRFTSDPFKEFVEELARLVARINMPATTPLYDARRVMSGIFRGIRLGGERAFAAGWLGRERL